MSVSACILSVSGPKLLPEEFLFLREAQPWGVILMGRSCQSRAQVRALTAEIMEALGREALIFIDQEGGRVARLKPPVWEKFPPAALYGQIYKQDAEIGVQACTLGHHLMGHELSQLRIRADCAPCCDLRQTTTHDAIGDRAFGYDPETVIQLSSAALAGLQQAGVLGCIKHMPGQGRATADSHYDLPRIAATATELQADFSIFKAVAQAAPMGMTGHVIMDAIDPDFPATISKKIIEEIIRGRIGFDGLLMTDDLGMDALGGSLQQRGRRAREAGCDVLLHCSGFLKDPAAILNEMRDVADAAGALDGLSLQRADRVMTQLEAPRAVAIDDLQTEYAELIAPYQSRAGV